MVVRVAGFGAVVAGAAAVVAGAGVVGAAGVGDGNAIAGTSVVGAPLGAGPAAFGADGLVDDDGLDGSTKAPIVHSPPQHRASDAPPISAILPSRGSCRHYER